MYICVTLLYNSKYPKRTARKNQKLINKIKTLKNQLAEKGKLIKENEIMGKVIIDIILHNNGILDTVYS